MSLNVKELKGFIEDLLDETEVVIQSIISGDEEYCSETLDISSTIDDNSGDKILVLDPKEVIINNAIEDEEVEEIAEYLIKFASDAFEHKDREKLIKVLKHYGKWI